MAYIAEKNITLKDGHECLLRNALPGDARAVRDFTVEAARTSEYLIMQPSELSETTWQVRSRLNGYLDSPAQLGMLAMDGPMIVGQITVTHSPWERVRHGVNFGIVVKDSWRGRGLGRAMITHMIDWAKLVPEIERIELHVHSENKAAIHLYENLGFEHEGRRQNAIRYGEDKFMDDLIMGMLLSPALRPSARLDIRYI